LTARRHLSQCPTIAESKGRPYVPSYDRSLDKLTVLELVATRREIALLTLIGLEVGGSRSS
jgi:hypothetical protein